MKGKWTFEILKDAAKEFMEDKALRLSAALAYYAIFSLAPLLIIVIGVAGLFLGEESVRGQVHQYLEEFMGSQSASTVESMMSAQDKAKSIGATIVGIIVLFFGATGVFGQLDVICSCLPLCRRRDPSRGTPPSRCSGPATEI